MPYFVRAFSGATRVTAMILAVTAREDAMNRARVFVQEMFGHNDKHSGDAAGLAFTTFTSKKGSGAR